MCIIELNDFIILLQNVYSGTAEDHITLDQQLFKLRNENVTLYLQHASTILLNDEGSSSLKLAALLAINIFIKPLRMTPLVVIRNSWMDPSNDDMSTAIKRAIIPYVTNIDERIRNIAAVSIALVLQIEGPRWSHIISDLINQIIDINASYITKIGIISTFCEIFQLPIFDNSILNEDLPEDFGLLIEFILNSLKIDENNLLLREKCALCLNLMISRIPQFFDDTEKVKSILNIMSLALPISSLNLYQNLHDILYQISTLFYKSCFDFMEDIFTLILIGLQCDGNQFKAISLDYWSRIGKFDLELITLNETCHHLISTDSISLLPIILNMLILVETNDNEINDNEKFSLPIYACVALKMITLHCPELVFQEVNIIIKEKLNSSNWIEVYSVLMILYSLASKKEYEPFKQFFEEIFPKIIFLISSNSLCIQDTVLSVLIILFKNYQFF